MRGTHVENIGLQFDAGIIPAYAGNTSNVRNSMVSAWDHPRVCGEHAVDTATGNTQAGSSPRMRGTPQSTRMAPIITGIIPAYAGNTVFITSAGEVYRDHPRVCGEHPDSPDSPASTMGSSPRMRGTPYGKRSAPCGRGIIPAYAGNTHGSPQPRTSPRDHPRVCGEHCRKCGFSDCCVGSSPRMRGTQRGVRNPRTALGIIPAYAGNTPSSSPSSVPVGDHPRVCGEHPRNVSQSIRPWGSSPRMRGTRTVRHSQRSPIGIIPAYAGNT